MVLCDLVRAERALFVRLYIVFSVYKNFFLGIFLITWKVGIITSVYDLYFEIAKLAKLKGFGDIHRSIA